MAADVFAGMRLARSYVYDTKGTVEMRLAG